jgi:hypothetical protein
MGEMSAFPDRFVFPTFDEVQHPARALSGAEALRFDP